MRVVTDLCAPTLEKKPRYLYGQFFTLYDLMLLLKANDTYAVGTGNPKHRMRNKWFGGECDFRIIVMMELLFAGGKTKKQ